MDGIGVRRYLQPLLYFGLAAGVHIILFLIPVRIDTGKTGETTRGMRVVAIKQAAPPDSVQSTPPPRMPPRVAETPSASDSATAGGPQGGGRSGGEVPYSTGQGSDSPVPGTGPATVTGERGGPPAESAFGSYLAKLRSERVQGWARESAGKAQKGWKGSGKGGEGAGWGSGSGFGDGSGDGSGSGDGDGPGTGKGGKVAQRGGGGYLDPRVQVVVTSYPPTRIEKTHGQVKYPDKKIKKHQYAAGWWNVFIQIQTDSQGGIVQTKVLRPETDGPLQRIFIQQVQDEISRWSFDRQSAEINVDVRFYVE